MRESPLDYYAILGVDPTAEDIVIRAAYKALAQRYHPDRFAGSQDEAHRRMSEITKAYEVLADPMRRKKYDRRRLTYTQSVATYFSNSSLGTQLTINPRDRRSAAAKNRRSRMALTALMIAVAVLSVINVYHYSPQIRDWLGSSPPAATPADAQSRPVAEAPATAAAGVVHPGSPPSGVAQPGSPPAGSAIKVRKPGMGAGGAAVAGAAPVEAQTPPVQRADAAPAADAPQARDERRAPAKRPAAPAPPRDGPGAAPPVSAASEPCLDTVAALGLCGPNRTARNR